MQNRSLYIPPNENKRAAFLLELRVFKLTHYKYLNSYEWPTAMKVFLNKILKDKKLSRLLAPIKSSLNNM